MSQAHRRLWMGGVLLAVASCGQQRPITNPRQPLLGQTPSVESYPSPAVWRYHPSEPAQLHARKELPAKATLFAGARGERWLRQGRKVQAASALAPELLTAILKGDNGFLFVGKSGTIYSSDEPLGPFTQSSAPLDPLVRLSAARDVIVGVRRDGRLSRTEDAGASWQLVGPEAARFADIAMADDGRGLALAIPERLYSTKDRGATWQAQPVASFGAHALELDARQNILVESVLGTKRWDQSSGFSEVSKQALTVSRYQLGATPPRGPSAVALRDGSAVIIGDEYLELESKKKDRWQLWRGPLNGRLRSKDFPQANGCSSVRLAGYGATLYLACTPTSSTSTSLTMEIHRSTDSGKKWKQEPYRPEARLKDFSMAVGERGQLLVTGICPQLFSQRGCIPHGVFYRKKVDPEERKKREERKKSKNKSKSKPTKAEAKKAKPKPGDEWELAPAATPALKGAADRLAFSVDGRVAYAVGQRTKNGAYAVYVSHDGGKSFQPEDIDQLVAPESGEESSYRWRAQPSNQVKVIALAPAEDGTVSLVFEQYNNQRLVVTDDEGRLISSGAPPSDATALGAVGSRALAINPAQKQAWETVDGGASWQTLGSLPVTSCPKSGRCDVAVFCHPTGCVVGDELSRVGWGGQDDDGQGTLSPPSQRETLLERRLRSPLSCGLEEGAWRDLANVTQLPDARSSGLGKTAWFVVAHDEQQASVVLHQGLARGRTEQVVLLPPMGRPESMAIYSSTQNEGAVALRYPILTGGDTRLRNVEVAWYNALEGRLSRARLPDAGTYRPGDYVGGGKTQQARPALVSIASGGVYVRIHYGPYTVQPTLFLDGKNVASVPNVDWPSAALKNYRDEMVHLGGAHVPIRLAPDGATFLRGGAELAAFTTGLAKPAEFGVQQRHALTYVDGRAALYLSRYQLATGAHSAQIFPMRKSGAALDDPLPAPTQLDLADRPARCGPTESAGPRVVAGFLPGSRHPVLVTDATEPMRLLLTESAVLHGTPDSACATSFDARSVALDPDDSESSVAILPTDDLEHAWIFREIQGLNGQPVIQVRAMSCRFDPSAEVPPEALGVDGILVPRQR